MNDKKYYKWNSLGLHSEVTVDYVVLSSRGIYQGWSFETTDFFVGNTQGFNFQVFVECI